MPPARVLLSVVLTQHCPVSSRNSTLNVRLKRGDEEESRNNNNNKKTQSGQKAFERPICLQKFPRRKKGGLCSLFFSNTDIFCYSNSGIKSYTYISVKSLALQNLAAGAIRKSGSNRFV